MDAKTAKVLEGIIKKLNYQSKYSDLGVHEGEWRVSFADVYLTATELSLLQDLRYGDTGR